MLRAEVFPFDSFTEEEISSMVDELISRGLVAEYDGMDGRTYWHVMGWHHQKIDKPGDPKCPPFEDSRIIRRTFDESSPSVRGLFATEGSVREGSRKVPKKKTSPNGESKEKFDPHSLALLAWPDQQDLQAAWLEWCTHRSQIRKPLTRNSAHTQIDWLSSMTPEHAVTTIRHTIRNGWQGLREPDANGHTPRTMPEKF
jgi:hypothetical protein